jgi:MYXO-CTERM domain-containing protein
MLVCPCRKLLFLAAAMMVLTIGAAPSFAQDKAELAGELVDAATGTPVADATVEVLGTNETTTTDANGQFLFELPEGTYDLSIEATVGKKTHRSRLVNQHVPQYRPSRARVYTDHFLEQGVEPLEHPHGLPTFSGRLPDDGPDSFDLRDLFEGSTNPTHYTIPDTPPTQIRVGRRQDETGSQGCTDSNNPIVAIDEMHLDEYVKGVLPPEIGVFRSLDGVSEVYKTFAIGAKSYALYFMLRYDSSNRRTLGRSVPPHDYSWFHIDDTACNQRYSDDRLTITTEAAEAVQSKILANASDTNVLDKYEYAASCGKHGTLPEHGSVDNLVSDDPSVSSCVGDWCGHDGCAGHETNPHVSSSNRCLVRGICQWGAASWGETGQSYTWMLDHYQPHLQVRTLGDAGEATVVLTGYVYTDQDAITDTGIADATVELNDGQSTTTNADGQFHFDAVEVSLGSVDITASKSGYETNTRSKDLEAGVTNWGSVQLVESSSGTDDAGGGDEPGQPDVGPVADTGPSSDVGQPDAADSGLTDTGSGERPNTNSRLGPLVHESAGVDGGCSVGGPAGPPWAFVMLAALGLVGVRLRRIR